jgi:hypothetical protein
LLRENRVESEGEEEDESKKEEEGFLSLSGRHGLLVTELGKLLFAVLFATDEGGESRGIVHTAKFQGLDERLEASAGT